MEKEPFHKVFLDISSCSKKNVEETIIRLLLEYFQLVLYLRSQIPEPVQLMKKKLQKKKSLPSSTSDCQKVKKSELHYNNKCIQLLKDLDKLKESISFFVKECAEVEAVVTIGSTPVSIKEAFSFNVNVEDSLEVEDLYSLDCINSHARKFCMMMVQSPLCSGSSLTPTNTRMFIRSKSLNAAEGCNRWPDLRWPSKKHLLDAQINFHSSKFLSDSLILSTDSLNITNRENLDPEKCKDQAVAWSSDAQENEIQHNVTCAAGDKDKKTTKRLSATEALNAILEEDDAVPESTSSEADNDLKNNQVWFELPIVIKGFKL